MLCQIFGEHLHLAQLPWVFLDPIATGGRFTGPGALLEVLSTHTPDTKILPQRTKYDIRANDLRLASLGEKGPAPWGRFGRWSVLS